MFLTLASVNILTYPSANTVKAFQEIPFRTDKRL